MSLPKKGARTIVVGELTYKWLIRKRPTYSEGINHSFMRIAVELDSKSPTGLLMINTQVFRPDNWIKPTQIAVTPKIVRSMIEKALESGWSPESKETYHLEFNVAPNGM